MVRPYQPKRKLTCSLCEISYTSSRYKPLQGMVFCLEAFCGAPLKEFLSNPWLGQSREPWKTWELSKCSETLSL